MARLTHGPVSGRPTSLRSRGNDSGNFRRVPYPLGIRGGPAATTTSRIGRRPHHRRDAHQRLSHPPTGRCTAWPSRARAVRPRRSVVTFLSVVHLAPPVRHIDSRGAGMSPDGARRSHCRARAATRSDYSALAAQSASPVCWPPLRLLLDAHDRCRAGLRAASGSPSSLVGDSWWQLAVAAALAVVLTQLAFLGHDSAHRQIFTSGAWNDWTARIIAGGFVGLSASWWRNKHNRHHAQPEPGGRGPGHRPGVVAWTSDVVEQRRGLRGWFGRNQGWFFFPLLTLEGMSLHLSSVRALTAKGPVANRAVDLTIVVSRLVALRRDPAAAAAARQGRRVLLRADGAVRRLPRRLVRAEPQGHADHPRGDEGRLPAPPGAHVPQHPRRRGRRLRDGRPELPGRAPPLPEHAAPEPQARPAGRARVLRAAGREVHRGRLLPRRTGSSSSTSTTSASPTASAFDCPVAAQYGR